MQPKIKLNLQTCLCITLSSRRGPLENRVNSHERKRKNQKRKVKNSVFAEFSQTESVLNGVRRALCVCTCKAAKLRMNTLITGYTIMRASGNELFRFFFQTLSRSSARASILVSKGKPSFVRMEFEGAMVGCAQANVCTAASG